MAEHTVISCCFRYYTNHSTKFGQYVKHHAARILVYVGLGDRVGSRVNLFQNFGKSLDFIPGAASWPSDLKVQASVERRPQKFMTLFRSHMAPPLSVRHATAD